MSIIFCINGVAVRAPRDVVAAESPVLRKFSATKGFGLCLGNEFHANDCTVDAIKAMIAFMSTKELILIGATDLQVIEDALHCAQRFEVNGMADAIARHLETLMTVETVEQIVDFARKNGIRSVTDTLDTHLAALLTDRNVVIVGRMAFKYGPPSDRFLAALMTFLYSNFDETVAEVLHESILSKGKLEFSQRPTASAANSDHSSPTDLSAAIRSRQLAPVVQEFDLGQECVDAANEQMRAIESNSGVPLAQDVHTLHSSLPSDESQPSVSGDHFMDGHESPPPVAKAPDAIGSREQLSPSESAIDGGKRQPSGTQKRKNTKTDESEPKPKGMTTRSSAKKDK